MRIISVLRFHIQTELCDPDLAYPPEWFHNQNGRHRRSSINDDAECIHFLFRFIWQITFNLSCWTKRSPRYIWIMPMCELLSKTCILCGIVLYTHQARCSSMPWYYTVSVGRHYIRGRYYTGSYCLLPFAICAVRENNCGVEKAELTLLMRK